MILLALKAILEEPAKSRSHAYNIYQTRVQWRILTSAAGRYWRCMSFRLCKVFVRGQGFRPHIYLEVYKGVYVEAGEDCSVCFVSESCKNLLSEHIVRSEQ